MAPQLGVVGTQALSQHTIQSQGILCIYVRGRLTCGNHLTVSLVGQSDCYNCRLDRQLVVPKQRPNGFFLPPAQASQLEMSLARRGKWK